jgi:hypothetical protein
LKLINKFWELYENNLHLNIGIALGLFLWQIIHLIWLFGDVILRNTLGFGFFDLSGGWEVLMAVIDYTEIPAILSVSLLYVNDLRKGFNTKSFLYLVFLNTQWLHLFWITDEFVIEKLIVGGAIAIPLWLAWLAIFIDYLEVPVIYDTTKRFITALKERRSAEAILEEIREV